MAKDERYICQVPVCTRVAYAEHDGVRLCKSHRAWSNNHMGLMPYHAIQRRRTRWAGKSCAVPQCGRPVVAKGLCASHWSWRRLNDGEMPGHRLTPTPVPTFLSVIERIELRIVKDDITGCWVYGGKKNKGGYGVIKHRGRLRFVHRLMYERLVGRIPEGMTCDHLCFRTSCCNPEHLEVVSHGENSRRSNAHRRNGRPAVFGEGWSVVAPHVLTTRARSVRAPKVYVVDIFEPLAL